MGGSIVAEYVRGGIVCVGGCRVIDDLYASMAKVNICADLGASVASDLRRPRRGVPTNPWKDRQERGARHATPCRARVTGN